MRKRRNDPIADSISAGFGCLFFCALLIWLLVYFTVVIPFIIVGKLLENVGAIAVLLVPILIIYLHSLYEERKILKKQTLRATQAAVIRVAAKNKGIISIPLLSFETEMGFKHCEQVLKEMEGKEILRRVSVLGKGAEYRLDPKTLANYNHRKTLVFHTATKWYSPLSFITVIALLCILFFFDIQQNAYSYPLPFIISGICSAVLLSMFIWYSRKKYLLDIRRREEGSVLKYVKQNLGELYLKELPYYTSECYETAEPMISKWHQNNYCTVTYTPNRETVYKFPYLNSYYFEDENDPYDPYYPEFDQIHNLFRHRKTLLAASCFAFMFAVIGGYLLLMNYNIIFFAAFGAILGAFITMYILEKKGSAEEKKRAALRVAEATMGVLSVSELALQARMTMEEAENLLQQLEQDNIARKMEPGVDSAPLYMISGIVSMRERMQSEHV